MDQYTRPENEGNEQIKEQITILSESVTKLLAEKPDRLPHWGDAAKLMEAAFDGELEEVSRPPAETIKFSYSTVQNLDRVLQNFALTKDASYQRVGLILSKEKGPLPSKNSPRLQLRLDYGVVMGDGTEGKTDVTLDMLRCAAPLVVAGGQIIDRVREIAGDSEADAIKEGDFVDQLGERMMDPQTRARTENFMTGTGEAVLGTPVESLQIDLREVWFDQGVKYNPLIQVQVNEAALGLVTVELVSGNRWRYGQGLNVGSRNFDVVKGKQRKQLMNLIDTSGDLVWPKE